MTTRVAGAVAAITLALGILIGAAGVIVIREAPDPVAAMAGQMGGMQSMMGMMGGSMMGGPGTGGPGTRGPGTSGPGMGPGPLHDLHHPSVSPEPTP